MVNHICCQARPIAWVMSLVAVSILSLGVGCRSDLTSDDRLEMIFASNPDCSAPCWNNIIPGQTSETELFEAAVAAPSGQFGDFELSPSASLATEGTWHSWDVKDAELKGSALIRDGHVSLMLFQPTSELLLEPVFNVLSNPDHYIAVYSPGERPFVSLVLFYVAKGVVVSSRIWWNSVVHDDCQFDINSTMTVDDIYLVEPEESPVQLTSNIYSLSHLSGIDPSGWAADNSLTIQRCPP